MAAGARRRILFRLPAILLAAWPAVAPAGPRPTVLVAERLHYAVLRDGSPIGTEEVEIVRRGRRVSIVSRAQVAVAIAGITLFRLSTLFDEEWLDGRLDTFAARTDYDGHLHEVMALPEGSGLAVTENGVRRLFPGVTLVGTLLNPATVRQSRLIDPINGKPRAVRVEDRGIDPLQVEGRRVPAHRYAMSGGLQREIWYGPDGRVLRVELPAVDGSLIRVTLL